jgi:predicted small lipoprotein YifL
MTHGAALVSATWALALAACGQTGPLYLPEEGEAVVTPAATPTAPASAIPSSTMPVPPDDQERERKNESSTVPTPPQ